MFSRPCTRQQATMRPKKPHPSPVCVEHHIPSLIFLRFKAVHTPLALHGNYVHAQVLCIQRLLDGSGGRQSTCGGKAASFGKHRPYLDAPQESGYFSAQACAESFKIMGLLRTKPAKQLCRCSSTRLAHNALTQARMKLDITHW